LLFIDRIKPRGFLVAATNLDRSLDPAILRRFDEVIWFDMPDSSSIERYLRLKFKHVKADFEPSQLVASAEGFSYADIERVCIQAMKTSIIERRKTVTERDFKAAVAEEVRRRSGNARLIVTR
jgi:ATP-dependent 26S proteasome regulatory subunit